jgi:hypothetical protein
VLRDASGFILAPLAALRRTKKNHLSPSMGGGALNLMGVVTAVQTSLPAAERFVTGALVAALAIGGTSVGTPPEAKARLKPVRRVVDNRDAERASAQASRPAPQTPRVAVEIEEPTSEAPLPELPLDTPLVENPLDPITERVEGELDTHTKNTGNGGPVDKPSLPDELRSEIKDRAGDVQEAASALTTEGS